MLKRASKFQNSNFRFQISARPDAKNRSLPGLLEPARRSSRGFEVITLSGAMLLKRGQKLLYSRRYTATDPRPKVRKNDSV